MPYREESIPILSIALQDGVSMVRAAAIAALGHPSADEAHDTLLTAAKDPSIEVRSCAAFAIGSIGWTEEAARALERLSRETDRELREWALLALERDR